nr:MAG TPA: hypothetical protein [Caudoviricetes sp.]
MTRDKNRDMDKSIDKSMDKIRNVPVFRGTNNRNVPRDKMRDRISPSLRRDI